MSYFGKYRGLVTDVTDPLNLARLKARVPDVFGNKECGWALPCLPFAGQSMGFFALPKVGAGVWIEFEHGDPEYPIWSGCYYHAVSEVPPNALVPPSPKALLRTAGGNSLMLDDTPLVGGLQLKSQGGEVLKLSSKGLELFDAVGQKIFSVGPEGFEFAGQRGEKLSINTQQLVMSLIGGAKIEMLGKLVKINDGALEVM